MDTSGSSGPVAAELGSLIAEVQSLGLRVEAPMEEGRRGGAGPADAGMIWIEGFPVTFPHVSDFASSSPFVLRHEQGEGWGLYRDDRRLAGATLPARPAFYDLETADGVPYWKIALLHLDSLASTVIQTCVYWGNADQCRFCAIETSLEAGRTVAVKRPEQLAEVALAAKELDGAVDVTLTTGTTRGPDKGALYVGRCAQAVKAATGMPVQAQFEPPDDHSVFEALRDLGVDTVGMHVESFDQRVLDEVAPAKGRTGVEGYFRAWERAVEVFGRGQVTTYVILGMGEDPEVTVESCRRAVDMGVYPFVVPLRPSAGSLMEAVLPPDPGYVQSVYRRVAPQVLMGGLESARVKAGCARCNACSAMSAFEGRPLGANRRTLPVLQLR
jgi:radical SAM protein (TIGR04043 family)